MGLNKKYLICPKCKKPIDVDREGSVVFGGIINFHIVCRSGEIAKNIEFYYRARFGRIFHPDAEKVMIKGNVIA